MVVVHVVGKGKYELSDDDWRSLLPIFEEVCSLTEEGCFERAYQRLGEALKRIENDGRRVEVFRPADYVVPPFNLPCSVLRKLIGIS